MVARGFAGSETPQAILPTRGKDNQTPVCSRCRPTPPRRSPRVVSRHYRPNVVMVPLTHAFAQMLARETAHAAGRRRRKRRHLRLFCRKYIAVRREPIGFLFSFALVLFGVAMVEHLHFNAFRKRAITGLELADGPLGRPKVP